MYLMLTEIPTPKTFLKDRGTDYPARLYGSIAHR